MVRVVSSIGVGKVQQQATPVAIQTKGLIENDEKKAQCAPTKTASAPRSDTPRSQHPLYQLDLSGNPELGEDVPHMPADRAFLATFRTRNSADRPAPRLLSPALLIPLTRTHRGSGRNLREETESGSRACW